MANIQIYKSSLMTRNEFLATLPTEPYKTEDERIVMTNRSKGSLCREWAAHKVCYWLHIKRSSTESVDLNYPQKWYMRLGYFIVGGIADFFFKVTGL